MNRVVLDTNVFIRLILNDIPTQADLAEKLFKAAQAGEAYLIVPQIVIFEIAFVLTKYYKIEKEEMIDKLTSILATSYLNIENRDIFQQSLNLLKQTNLSFVDCFLLCTAKSKDSTLFTFDEDLQKLMM